MVHCQTIDQHLTSDGIHRQNIDQHFASSQAHILHHKFESNPGALAPGCGVGDGGWVGVGGFWEFLILAIFGSFDTLEKQRGGCLFGRLFCAIRRPQTTTAMAATKTGPSGVDKRSASGWRSPLK